MKIELRDLSKRFGDFTALDGIDLDIADGELVALLGPSGCGKTTLLRLIAGLEQPDHGTIRFGGADVGQLPVRSRGVGFVFQHYALFRHLSVFENVAFGLRVRPRRERLPESALKAKVQTLLDLVHLGGLAQRYPDQLSGGQRQRVALARALVVEPRVLLLDEPFGALDAQVRRELRRWLRQLHLELGVTSVFVTHDQEEALDVADRIVVIDRGRIVQVGSAEQIYADPATPFVCEFLGETNRLPARVIDGHIELDGAPWPWPAATPDFEGPAQICIRPHDLKLERDGRGLPATVRSVRRWGGRTRIELDAAVSGARLLVDGDDPHGEPPAVGSAVRLGVRRYQLFPA